ncbi:MAG: hypothetical protein COB85_01875 [Bacteroidetes bacterium]|nr:MAG: hypothetical protein COB85_01875 [Bacteroidota bacterium]
MKPCIFFFIAFQFSIVTGFAQYKTNEITETLIGTWVWEHTKICQRSNPADRTPQSEGYTLKLIFDSKTMRLFRNDSLRDESFFEILLQNGGDFFNSHIYRGMIKIEDDQLSISTCGSDGVHRVYTRMGE